MAFYSVERETLFKVEDNIFGPGYSLIIQDREIYEYPVYGWYWFDSDEEAETALGVKLPEPPEAPQEMPPPPFAPPMP